ncbi:1,4-alpha-glucan branching enzyme [Paenibacillus sp. yr247]|uniref:1,4-alpha-glucan branching protein domain-containing protein n=1 Tax=Paenibacillus sp. yr247 TaxID=1761880 RepID=UPI00087FFCE6|nr:1,4-alpha-glucan branching protein domain-containing protein [Paenibacillus sp. yr247]SDN30059.1 1,4-alpha-glucan branching enzyme [Paenibacillus sp. yr247]
MINRIKSKPELKGYFALVLHAHLPYIRHQDQDDVMEERWFYEAMTETYLPLLEVMNHLSRDQIDFRMTFSMTPTLLSLFSDPLMQERYRAYLSKLIGLADAEQIRLQKNPSLLPLAIRYSERFRELQNLYNSCKGNVIKSFKHYQDLGLIEIVTSAATHGFLPLMKTEEAIKAQIMTAVRDYERHFGQKPRGIWLPECGYTPGIDRILKQAGIHYFFTDSTAVAFASPQPNRELVAPLMTPYGVTAFPRDPESASQVWSDDNGYPGDFNYREYYRDIGWDLGWNDLEEWAYIKPHVLPTNERVNTGIKYYRITGNGNHREPYHPELALKKAAEHADDFLTNRQKQAQHWHRWLDRKPIIVAPYDAELFGHWWYEGPSFLEQLCRKMFLDQHIVKMITPSEYLNEYPIADVGKLNESSWGRNHSAEVWLQGHNDWIYRHLHQAEERMILLATKHEHLGRHSMLSAGVLKRALNQAARELMLAQSSDWAFIMDSQTVVDYAIRRTKSHLGCFHHLCDQVDRELVDEILLAVIEEKDNCFPAIDYQDYISIQRLSPIPIIPSLMDWETLLEETKHRPNVFMLAWEYPPKHVGGLSTAVHELSEALAARGENVHVITTSAEGAPSFERMNGVYVHRLPVDHSGDTHFYHWTFEMNLAMIDHLVKWNENGGRIDLLHAHDWMVFHTAREIKASYGIPLIATIHATEWGRNQGNLYSDLQKKIHHLEWKLTYEANRVFVCSLYMKEEVGRIFNLPSDKVSVHPNGIQILSPSKEKMNRPDVVANQDKVIFYIGRLVYEKGIQILLAAMPKILSQVPRAKLIIAGSGPMEGELRSQAAHLGDRALFTGFVHDTYRTQLYQSADVCVIPSLYEPFGIVALEAMANRKPLVLSDTGGLAEIIRHGVDGYKALPGHVDSLAWHITEMLLQPQQAAKMADNAYQLLQQHYQWSHIAQNIQDEYRKLTYYQPVIQVEARL